MNSETQFPLTVAELATELRVSRTTVDKLLKEHDDIGFKVGNRRRYAAWCRAMKRYHFYGEDWEYELPSPTNKTEGDER